jgi:hypothetical protein
MLIMLPQGVKKHVPNRSKLRFAVAAFDTWELVQPAVQDLADGRPQSQDFNYLGLQRVLAGALDPVAGDSCSLPLRPLSFPGNPELICCTDGAVADRLAGRLGVGAQTLKAALSHWLIPRHAAHLQDAVESGRIVLWVQISDVESERRAYQSLLAKTSSPVGVHDLIGD